MQVRALVINEEARRKAAAIVAHAMDHPYRPGPGVPPPADDPRLVGTFGDYRAVFSYTWLPNDVLARHLSVSVPEETRGPLAGKNYPNPITCFELALLFGFEERPDNRWETGPHKVDRCVVIVQEVKR